MADCEGFCRLSASMVARQSPFMAYACAACADACRDCARECDKLDASTMKDCASACRECETSCRTMIKAMGGQTVPAADIALGHSSARPLRLVVGVGEGAAHPTNRGQNRGVS